MKLPLDECGGVRPRLAAIPAYRFLGAGELDCATESSPSGGISPIDSRCPADDVLVVSISAACWSPVVILSRTVDSSSSCICRPSNVLSVGGSLSSAPKLILLFAKAKSGSSSSIAARDPWAAELDLLW